MARHAKSFTVGTSEVLVTKTDITAVQDQYYVIVDDAATSPIWVNMAVGFQVTGVAQDEHVPVRPGEAVPFDALPLGLIATTGGNSVTVGRK